MCEVNAYKITGNKETLLMEDVEVMVLEEGKIILTSLKGGRREISGRIKKIDFLGHKLIIGD